MFVVATAISAITCSTSIDEQDARLGQIREAGRQDAAYTALKNCIRDGWPPSRAQVDQLLAPFYAAREHLYVQDDVILHGPCLVIPAALRPAVLRQLHAAHQGVSKTLQRAHLSVWWPTIASDVTHAVQRCQPCREALPSHAHEPLQRGPEADRPFQKVHADLLVQGGTHYLVVTDEFSGWPCLLPGAQDDVCGDSQAPGMLFLAHMVPTVFKSDNGPQFVWR